MVLSGQWGSEPWGPCPTRGKVDSSGAWCNPQYPWVFLQPRSGSAPVSTCLQPMPVPFVQKQGTKLPRVRADQQGLRTSLGCAHRSRSPEVSLHHALWGRRLTWNSATWCRFGKEPDESVRTGQNSEIFTAHYWVLWTSASYTTIVNNFQKDWRKVLTF